MHVVQDGPRQAPPLLLIHGSGVAGISWQAMIPALAARHHVIRVDLPGCGHSPPADSYEVTDQARRLADLLDDLGISSATVVGHSSGGYAATALAERRPDLVGRIVLISTGPSVDALLPQPAVLRVLLAPPFGPLLWPRRSDAMIRKGISATAARPVEISDAAVAELRRTTYRTFRRIIRANTAYLRQQAVPERLAGLGIPLLVVFGGADPRWDPQSARSYTAVPGSRIEMLPGVGHVPLWEAPDATAALVLEAAGGPTAVR
ncbi:alpha/beta hydrolase [Yinghuangia sp. KLBMP8922]|uniref:Alpha/beta hydrolase n=2 Tax=Yinghuangia soli TaxID=2908204 RepID=A0AA41Q7N4_9ACTN|nr:alpha/beta hydrolase [Yinghuangia soli]MCF2533110.1 alpha/beta hydrolase [Yinghuangia soli]